MTGKKRLLRNSAIIYEEKTLRNLMNYDIQIGPHSLNFSQHGEKFELRVDNESFMYAYNNLRQRDHFVYDNKHENSAAPNRNQGPN
jgi:hypothetical protein